MTRQANALLIILISFLFAYWLRFGNLVLGQDYLVALLLTLIISSIVLPATGAFRRDFEWAVARRLRRIIAGWSVVLLALISLAAALKTTDYYSRIWFGTWTLVSTFGIITVLLITHAVAIRKRNRDRRINPVALVGSGKAALRVESQITNDPSSDMFIAARFGERWSDDSAEPVSSLAAYLESNPVHAVWIAVPWEDKLTLDASLHALRDSTADVHVVPDMEQYRLLNQSVSEWGGLPVISLSGTPMTGSESRLKNVFDWLGALLLSVVLSPFLFVFAVLVKISSAGPVFFKQNRHGVGGEAIEIYKFRTMKLHQESEGTVTQAREDDERITGIGRFLRKTSFDELPQLLNILKGEMSLVGPRPHAMEHNDLFKSRIPKYMLRHKVKPGMTGWAQVHGYRGRTETREKMARRIEHDLWYIQNWSLWLDLKIVLMTPFVMIHRNAY